jgi:hypothetical protein
MYTDYCRLLCTSPPCECMKKGVKMDYVEGATKQCLTRREVADEAPPSRLAAFLAPGPAGPRSLRDCDDMSSARRFPWFVDLTGC